MGDIADMMLDGILDAKGEYTGRNPGHPVYPAGWFGNKNAEHFQNKNQALNFLRVRGITNQVEQEVIVLAFAKQTTSSSRTRKQAFSYIAKNWKAFKSHVDLKIGYVKPSKQKNEQ